MKSSPDSGFLKWAIPGLFSCIFGRYQTNIFYNNTMGKISIHYPVWDLNPRPLIRQSPPITRAPAPSPDGVNKKLPILPAKNFALSPHSADETRVTRRSE